jgi:hypothetical protein
MDEDGGLSKHSGNKAGAKYGTGYCDAQCPRDLKFIDGEANVGEWKESSNDPNAGVGNYGSYVKPELFYRFDACSGSRMAPETASFLLNSPELPSII